MFIIHFILKRFGILNERWSFALLINIILKLFGFLIWASFSFVHLFGFFVKVEGWNVASWWCIGWFVLVLKRHVAGCFFLMRFGILNGRRRMDVLCIVIVLKLVSSGLLKWAIFSFVHLLRFYVEVLGWHVTGCWNISRLVSKKN